MKNFRKFIASNIFKIGESVKSPLEKIVPKKVLKKAKLKLINSQCLTKNERQRIPFSKGEYPFGVNLFGYIKSPSALGEGCRLLALALEKASIPFGIIDTSVGTLINKKDNKCKKKIMSKPKYSINVFHINPEEMLRLKLSLPDEVWDKRFNIGFWVWDLPEFPDEWFKAFSLVDEVWTPSNFCVDCFSKKSPVPVKLMKYGFSVEALPKFDRKYFGLERDKFIFLVVYDNTTNFQRKNPIGAIKAFKRAFHKEDNSVGMVVKLANPTAENLVLLNLEIDGFKNISIIDKAMTKREIFSLISCSNVVISLHRSESFGILLAEAMLLKTPVIATGWSGNSDFMTTDTACCVDSDLTEIDKNYTIYKASQFWASPDIIQSAVFMKIIKADERYRKLICENGYKLLAKKYSLKSSSNHIYKRLIEINNNIL